MTTPVPCAGSTNEAKNSGTSSPVIGFLAFFSIISFAVYSFSTCKSSCMPSDCTASFATYSVLFPFFALT
ncbi:Uncharacterised protein [uncultured archaeon]|nr:Uncharacterised protein [uncultured archaeon]